MAYYRRLRDLREDSEKTQSEIGQYLGTTAQYYGRYEKGDCELPLFRAKQLADYYGVSLDYIADRTDRPEPGFHTGLTEEERSLIAAWRAMSERNKGRTERYISERLLEQKKDRDL